MLLALASLPLALPLVSASAAYLNARHGFANDWPLVSSLVASNVSVAIKERRDRLNMFYDIEENALSTATADRPFLIYGGRRYTYKESYSIILRYARFLREEFGVQKGDVVAMDFMNSDVFVWLWFALWSLGAKPAFINYNLTGQPLIHSLKTSQARLVLVDPEVQKEFSEIVLNEISRDNFRDAGGKVEVFVVDSAAEAKIASLAELRDPDEVRGGQTGTDMAILIYTSGTTGLPKPAIVSWTKTNTAGRFIKGYMPFKKDDILYTVSLSVLSPGRPTVC